MSAADEAAKPHTPAALESETPPRPRASMAALVLAVLAVGYTLWATQDLILPVLLAMFFALVGNPIIRLLQRLRIPRFLGALAVLCSGIAITVLLGLQLVQPAGEWIREAPRELRSLAPKLQKLTRPVQEANKAAENIARAAGGESTAKPVQVVKTEVNDPYKSLKTTLKAEIDREAWSTLNSDTSRPFDKPKSGRIAVKVINHLGDEVMKVFKV